MRLHRRIFQGREDILFFQERIVFENLSMRCTRTEEAQDITHPDAEAANTGAAAAFVRFQRDTVEAFFAHVTISG